MNKLNKNGFTLVELLATIVILGVIASIALVSIDGMLDEADKTECENVLLSIKSATKDYVSNNRFNMSNNADFTMPVDKLIDDGFLSSPINNPFDKKPVEASKLYVYVELNDDYTYKEAVIKNGDVSITPDVYIITCDKETPDGTVLFPGY